MEIEQTIKFKNYSAGGSLTGPAISKSKNFLAFGSLLENTLSADQSFMVSGYNLTTSIVVTAPAGFIINTNNGSLNQSPIYLVPTGNTVFSTIIYVKANPTAGIAYNADITLASTGAVTKTINVMCTGLVDTPPTYLPAELAINGNVPLFGEIGNFYSVVLSADFDQNDAGSISQLRIEKDGTIIDSVNGSDNIITTDSGNFDTVPIVYQAFADYAAGPLKIYALSGNIDARTPLVRNVNAPQAAEINFPGVTYILTGELSIFYGGANTVPANSSDVRLLPFKRLETSALSGAMLFQAGNSSFSQNISLSIPSTLNLVSIIDLTTGINVTANFTNTPFNVDDLAGNSNPYKNYCWTLPAPYSSLHTYQIIIS